MTDFFGALELELRAAAERRPRRPARLGAGLGALAATALVAAAVLIVLAVSGGGDSPTVTGGPKLDPVGTVIPKGEGNPPRSRRSVVVATGTQRLAGPWQLEIQPSQLLKDPESGEVMQPAGLKCIWLYMLDPPTVRSPTGAGYCGPFPRTPGFSRGQMNVPMPDRTRDGPRVPPSLVMIYGRAPERAEYFTLTAPGRVRMRAPVYDGPEGTRGDYYVTTVPPRIGRSARVNWLDKDREPGSRGIALLPPVTRR